MQNLLSNLNIEQLIQANPFLAFLAVFLAGALVSFTPAFWLLVPGALGLVGVADVLGGDSAAGASLVATLATMVAIALGVLAGSSLSNRMRRPAL